MTVDYATADGTAVAGTDYTAAAGTLTFAPGVTTQSIHLTALPTSLHAADQDVPGLARQRLAVRRRDRAEKHDDREHPQQQPAAERRRGLHDRRLRGHGAVLETATRASSRSASDAASTPTLTQVAAADRPGAAAGNHALRVAYTVGGYGGFSHDLATPQDWSSYDGFSFWVKGTGSGQKVEFEVKDGGPDAENGELWQSLLHGRHERLEEGAGRLREHEEAHRLPAGRRAQRRRAEPHEDVGLRGQPAGRRRDQHARVRRRAGVPEPADLRRLRGRQPDHRPGHGASPAPASSPGAGTRTAPRRCRSRSSTGRASRTTTCCGARGSRTRATAASATTSRRPLRRTGAATRASSSGSTATTRATTPCPGPAPQYEFEIKDGGADAEHAELWQTFFTDDWQGWHLIQIPFSSLKLRTDFQPTGGPINGTLDLNQMRGFALTEPPGTSNGEFDVDQFALYGVNTGATTAPHQHRRLRSYAVDPGGTATVGIKLTTNSDKPLDHDVTVNYSLGSGTGDGGHRLHRRERRGDLRRPVRRRAP